MRKGKTGSRVILCLWHCRWGLQNNNSKENKTKQNTPKTKNWNNCTTKTTDSPVRGQQHQLQISSALLSGQSYLGTCSWLFALLKPSARTAECFLFNGKLPWLHRNNPPKQPKIRAFTQARERCWLNRFDIKQAPLSPKQLCTEMIFTSPQESGEFGVMDHLPALCVLITVFHRLET